MKNSLALVITENDVTHIKDLYRQTITEQAQDKPEFHQFKLKNLLNKLQNQPKKHKPPFSLTKDSKANQLLH